MKPLTAKCFEIVQNENSNKIILLEPGAKKNGGQVADSKFAIDLQLQPGKCPFEIGKSYKITFDELPTENLQRSPEI